MPSRCARCCPCPACSGRAAAPAAEPGADASAAPGTRRHSAGLADAAARSAASRSAVADLPTDEVIAPGKIEANPNRMSKVVLPVAGRIDRVLVKIGDAVRKDQPLLTINSPDADAAMSAFLSAAGDGDAGAGGARQGAGRFRSRVRSVRPQRGGEEGRAGAESALAQAKAACRAGARGPRAGGAAAGRARPDARRLQAGGHAALAAGRQGARAERRARRVPQRHQRQRDDDRRPQHRVGHLAGAGKLHPVRPDRANGSKSTWWPTPARPSTAASSRIADTVDPQTRTVKVQAEMDNPQRAVPAGDVRQHPPHRIDGAAWR